MRNISNFAKIRWIRSLLLLVVFVFTQVQLLYSQSTQGNMSFSVRTVTYGGDHSPKHVLVIWVEDQDGFVVTRELNGDRRKEWLLTWNSVSSGNVVDATTGATLGSHTTHTVTWDCKDVNGNPVPDGEYTLNVEFTEEHSQGPLTEISFTKGTQSVSLNPADESNFKDMSLTYEPLAVQAAFSHATDGLSVTFTNNSTGAESYNWDFGDGSSSIEINPVNTYAGEGSYNVVLTATAGEISVTAQANVSVTDPSVGIVSGDREKPFVYSLENGDILVQFHGTKHIGQVNVFTLDGKLLDTEKTYSSGQVEIALSHLPAGFYLVQMEIDGKKSGQLVITGFSDL